MKTRKTQPFPEASTKIYFPIENRAALLSNCESSLKCPFARNDFAFIKIRKTTTIFEACIASRRKGEHKCDKTFKFISIKRHSRARDMRKAPCGAWVIHAEAMQSKVMWFMDYNMRTDKLFLCWESFGFSRICWRISRSMKLESIINTSSEVSLLSPMICKKCSLVLCGKLCCFQYDNFRELWFVDL